MRSLSSAPVIRIAAAALVFLVLLLAVPALDGIAQASPPPRAAGLAPAAASTITLTTGGFVPAAITVPAGAEVTWYNATGQSHVVKSGEAYRSYLPVVVRTTGSAVGQAAGPRQALLQTVAAGEAFSATVPPGGAFTHTFAVEGRYPYFAATAPSLAGVVFVVTPPDLAIAAWPVAQTVTQGKSVTFTVSVTGLHGMADAVGLAWGGYTSATAAWGANPVTPPASTTLAIAPDMDGPTGVFPLVITGMAGSLVRSAAVTLTVAIASDLPPDPADVAPPVDPSVPTDIASATEFLYTGPNPIQTGVAPGTIEITRVAVLRGRVLDAAGGPISGTKVTVLDYPELGQTLSRLDGMFDLAVNGGGRLTINYAKAGYLPVQRKAEAPWRDYAWLPDVVMIAADANAAAIDLTSPAMQVAQGSVMTDASGSRQATLLVPTGTVATLIFAGGVTETLPAFHVRLTEYTVGESGEAAMPGELPPQSGYTYAAEYTVDEAVERGALNVAFSQPLIHYSQNFLTFTVGTNVPSGYYDRVAAQWVAGPNGRVVKIVAITDSVAYLDTDTTPGIDNGVALGVTMAEREALGALYPAGQTLWRVPVSHLTPWDYNWPYGPPPTATAPNQPAPAPGRSPLPDDCEKKGSIIGCESQTLRQAAGIAGTPFLLYYASDRSPEGSADAYRLTIPLSGATLPGGLKRIDLQVYVAGRAFSQGFAPAANLIHTFVWDGKDGYGRRLQGAHPVQVRVGYVYQAVYRSPSALVQAFGQFGPELAGNQARGEVTIWQEWSGTLGALDTRGVGLGGWSLSVHHVYDTAGRVLYLGDGTRRSAEAQSNWIMSTAAGTGGASSTGDSGPAKQATLNGPAGIAIGPDGAFYVSEFFGNRVRRVDSGGIITTVAGIGTAGYNGDGIPAASAQLNGPWGLALGPDGSLYVAEYYNHRVRRVDPGGMITTVAGTGTAGYNGDGIAATSAQLKNPLSVAVGPDGSIYIGDGTNYRVRRVSPDGIISTVAGNGTQCPIQQNSCGDGNPGTSAMIGLPAGVAVDAEGRLFIAENQRVRRVGTDGIIRTVAGNGSYGFTGDGGPATQAQLWEPNDVAVAPDGSIYIAESSAIKRIRRVGPDGIITTVAGAPCNTGDDCSDIGDGKIATLALLSNPYGVDMAPDGSVYIADRSHHRVRRLVPALAGFSASDVVIPAEDGSEIYQFAASGRHLRTLNGLTGAALHTFAYDSAGRLATVTDGDGNVTTVERDAGGVPTAVTGPYGQRTTLAVDSSGYLASVTGPGGDVMLLESTAGGLLTTLTAPGGGLYAYTYDGIGRLTRAENPDGFKTLARVDGSTGYTVTVTTALGRQTTYRVERVASGGARRTTTDASGATTVAVYASDGGRLVRYYDSATYTYKYARVYADDGTRQVTYPDGTIATLKPGPDPRWGMLAPIEASLVITVPGMPAVSRTMTRVATVPDKQYPFASITLLDTINVGGSVSTSRYVGDSRTITNTSAAGRVSVATLDAQGRVTGISRGGEDPVTLTYDSWGRFAARQQGLYSTTVTYGPDGRVAALADSGGGQTQYGYDAAGRLIQTTLPGSGLYRFAYDAGSNLARVTPPLDFAHYLTYTAAGPLAAYEPPGGPGYTWTHNADGELTSVALPGDVTETYGLDAGGRTTTITYPSATNSFVFTDATSRVSAIVRTPTGPEAGQSISFTYAGGYVTGVRFTGAATGTFTYTYGAAMRLTGITIDADPKTVLAYDADGLLTQYGPFTYTRQGPRGNPTLISDGVMSSTYAYNGAASLAARGATVAGQALYQELLTYDNAGRVRQKDETVLGSTRTLTYTFDADGQLLEVRRDGERLEQYGYDANGNRTSRRMGNDAPQAATYDAQDRLVQQGGVAHTFDDAGYLTERGSDTFQYSARGELLQATVDGQTVSYAYDGLGRRVARTDAGGATQYLYGDPGYPFRVTAAREPSGERTLFYYDEGGRLFAFRRADAWFYVASDLLGTPRVVADATGTVTKSLEYDGFGGLLSDSNPALDLPIGFAGGLADSATGLVRFGARDYDPETGRWTARDPVLFRGQQINLYAYAGNNPVQMIDPWGLWAVGGSIYALVGGGGALSCEGWVCSLCLEVGVGFGTEVVVNPWGRVQEEGTSLNAEVGLALGPVASAKWVAKNKLDGCPTEHGFEVCGLGVCTGSDTELAQLKIDPGELPTAEQIYDKAKIKLEVKDFYQRCERYQW